MKKDIKKYDILLICFFLSNIVSLLTVYPIGFRFIYSEIFHKQLATVLFDENTPVDKTKVFFVILLFVIPIIFNILLLTKKTSTNTYFNYFVLCFILIDIVTCIFSVTKNFFSLGIKEYGGWHLMNPFLLAILFWGALTVFIIIFKIVQSEKNRFKMIIGLHTIYFVAMIAIMLNLDSTSKEYETYAVFCLIEDVIFAIIINMRLRIVKRTKQTSQINHLGNNQEPRTGDGCNLWDMG